MGHQCICCRVAFESPEEHRTHYQSDWHCYNLKRKVAKLPPLTQPEFVERKKTADDEKAAQKNKKRNKTSKKQQKNHEDNDVDNEENEEKENISKWKSGDNPRFRWFCERSAEIEAEEDEWEDLSDTEETDENIEIEEEVKDVDGAGDAMVTDDGTEEEDTFVCVLDGINQRDISLIECTFCGVIADTIAENMTHMESKHSFFLPSKDNLSDEEGLLTYLNRKVGVGNICITCNEGGKAFFSLQAVRDHMLKQGHARLIMTGEKAFEYSDFYEFEESDEDLDNIDEGNAGELVLATGAVIGHRSMWKYYKQSFDPRMALVPSKRANQINRYRAIGWGDTRADTLQNMRDFKRVTTWKKKHHLRIGMMNNKNDNMKHFVRRDGFCM